MCKGRGMYMYDMILAAIWVLVVSTLLSLVLFTLGSSVHIRSGAASLFCLLPDKAAPFSKALFLPIRVFILQGSFLMKFSA